MTENKNMADPGSPDAAKPEPREVREMPNRDYGNTADLEAAMAQRPGRGEPPNRVGPGEQPRNSEFMIDPVDENLREATTNEASIEDLPQEFKDLLTQIGRKEEAGELIATVSNKDATKEQIIEAAKKNGTPKSQLKGLLEAMGHDPAKVQAIMETEELPDELERNEDEPKSEDEQSIESTVDELSDQTREASQILAQAQRGDITEKEVKEFNDKANSTMESIKNKFFNHEDSLFRPEDRLKRLVLKPLVTVLLVTMVVYLACLSSLTRGSATRIGK